MEEASLAMRETASWSIAWGVFPPDQRLVGKAVVPTEMTIPVAPYGDIVL